MTPAAADVEVVAGREYPIREAQRARIPAVTHVDGSGRLQTVTRDTNPRYYALIAAFRELTGVPTVRAVR